MFRNDRGLGNMSLTQPHTPFFSYKLLESFLKTSASGIRRMAIVSVSPGCFQLFIQMNVLAVWKNYRAVLLNVE